jgi:hypothetical protein
MPDSPVVSNQECHDSGPRLLPKGPQIP